jgi:hypothetical protein
VNSPPKENEIRRLLSKALSRRRRKAELTRVRNARHLDLNRQLEDSRGEGIKYFFAVLILQGLLYGVYSRIGLS